MTDAARKLFEQMQSITAGEEMTDVMAALMETVCVGCCLGAATRMEAHQFADRFHGLLLVMISERHAYYRSQALEHPDEPGGRA